MEDVGLSHTELDRTRVLPSPHGGMLSVGAGSVRPFQCEILVKLAPSCVLSGQQPRELERVSNG